MSSATTDAPTAAEPQTLTLTVGRNAVPLATFEAQSSTGQSLRRLIVSNGPARGTGLLVVLRPARTVVYLIENLTGALR